MYSHKPFCTCHVIHYYYLKSYSQNVGVEFLIGCRWCNNHYLISTTTNDFVRQQTQVDLMLSYSYKRKFIHTTDTRYTHDGHTLYTRRTHVIHTTDTRYTHDGHTLYTQSDFQNVHMYCRICKHRVTLCYMFLFTTARKASWEHICFNAQ